jgi:WD40 repeat protein/tRNA A-37 threonylcarbamoyl transferase component Bud32
LTEAPGTVIGRYKLLEKLGEGGFGAVWAAEQKRPVKRRVALKIIKLGMDTKQVVARFEAERQALALMDHPNIAKVLDAGSTDAGRPYFVMELVKGVPIIEYCDQVKLSIQDRLDLFIKVCHAIQHAHQKGIIHRDIKPSNILITLHDGVPVPRIIDFGIAKATQQELTEMTIYTQHHQFIGTPAYMSPEQAEMSELDIDTRSDIYSLGVLLYELLTGRTPFDARELMQSGIDQMRKIIREQEPQRPSTKFATLQIEEQSTTATHSTDSPRLISLLRGDLDWIVMKCLEKDRVRRYETANGLGLDVGRHLRNEPVVARPPTAVYQFQKAWRRNRVVYTAAGMVVASLVIGISLSVWQAWLAIDAHREAEYARYISQIRLAAANLTQGNQNSAQDALLATPPEYRNWEWGHLVGEAWPPDIDPDSWTVSSRKPDDPVSEVWRGATARATVSLPFQNFAVLNRIAFRKDGRRVFTSPGDGNVYIWDAKTGGPQDSFEVSDSLIMALAVNFDDTFIAVGDTNRVTSLLNTETGEILWTYPMPSGTPVNARIPVNALWFSPDDRYVAVAYQPGDVDVLDAESGQRVGGFTEHSSEVESIQFFPDGRSIISASQDGSVRVWDLETGQETEDFKLAPYDGRKGISVQAINPTNLEEVATGGFGGALFLWNRVTGKRIDLPRGGDEITHLSFSHDGSCLFLVEGEKTIRVLDRTSGTELAVIPSSNQFHQIAISEDNERILTASRSHRYRIWSPVHMNPNASDTLSNAHEDIVIQAAFNSDGDRIVTASFDKTAKVWDAASQELLVVLRGHTHELIKADFSPDGQRVVSVDSHGTTRVWEWATRQELFQQEFSSDRFFRSAEANDGLRGFLTEFVAGFSSNPFSPSSIHPKVVVNSEQGMLVRHGIDGGDSFLLMGSTDVGWPAISPKGHLVAAMTDANDVIKVWDLKTGDLKYSLTGHDGMTFWAEFSRDSTRIVTGSMDRTAIVWDATNGKELVELRGHKALVSVARFSPDGERIATSGMDNESMIWNAETGDLLSTLKGPERRTTNVEFNPNPNVPRVLTTGLDNIVRIWDPKGPVGREILQITRDSKLNYATWSPDGRSILTCWKDGVVRLYKTIPWTDFTEINDRTEMADRIRGVSE